MDELIRNLNELRRSKDELNNKESLLCKPLLDIKKARWLKEQISDRDTFLIIAIRLFSPRVFMGCRMNRMVRREIAERLEISKEYVSTLIKIVLFRYNSMKQFHKEVNLQYEKILHNIKSQKN